MTVSTRRRGAEFFVRPDRYDTVRGQCATALFVEALEIEPVHGLGGRDQRDTVVVDWQLFRDGADVTHARMRLRARQLVRAAVHRNHLVEILRQRDGSLAVAGCTVDGDAPVGRAARDVLDQFRRVGRSIAAVAGGQTRKMILETGTGHRALHRARRCNTPQLL